MFSCERDEQCRLGTTGRCEPKENNFVDDDCANLRSYVCECDGVAAVPAWQ